MKSKRAALGVHARSNSGIRLHDDNQTIYLDKANKNTLHNEITTTDHALTRPWIVTKIYARESNPTPIWHINHCSENDSLVRIGMGRRLAAIKYRHKSAGEDSPTDDERVKAVLNGARRTLGVAPRELAAATSEKTIGMATLVCPGLAGCVIERSCFLALLSRGEAIRACGARR